MLRAGGERVRVLSAALAHCRLRLQSRNTRTCGESAPEGQRAEERGHVRRAVGRGGEQRTREPACVSSLTGRARQLAHRRVRPRREAR